MVILWEYHGDILGILRNEIRTGTIMGTYTLVIKRVWLENP